MVEVKIPQKTQIISFIFFVIFLCPFAYSGIIYVDDNAAITNDGSSWENAYLCLQDALTYAVTGEKPIEIRVAQGIYRPDQRAMIRQDQLRIISSGDWTATFNLINGVTIKGGYAGLGESNPDARDIKQYESILSGDLNADDDPNFSNIWDNSYHVVTVNGTDFTAVLDGFTITGGNADGDEPYDNGGGIYNIEGSPTLLNCTIRGNRTTEEGGGMYNHNSHPVLLNCILSGNEAGMGGGGMYNFNSSPTLNNCIFVGNYGKYAGGGMFNNECEQPMLSDCTFYSNISSNGSGGGMYNDSSNPVLLNCIFKENSAPGRSGGAMHNRHTSEPVLTNCLFISNSAINGGGMENINDSIPILLNCTFSFNFAENIGGGTSNLHNSRLTLINCILWGNLPNEISGSAFVSYSDIQGGWSGVGINNIDTDPLFADPENGDYHLKSMAGRWNSATQNWVIDQISSPCIDAGDPETPVGLERLPNGDRINMGAYGGTPEASLSVTQKQQLTLPGQASNPNPPDGAVNVDRNIILSWTPGFEGALHNIYFGSEFVHVNPSNDNSIFVGNQSDTSYNPGLLNYGRTYYWRVDEIDSKGTIITGQVWSFTVAYGPPKGRACFTGDTPVWVDGKLVPISKAAAAQVVSSVAGKNKIEMLQIHNGTFTCYDILLDTGKSITVAENHYFMTEAGRWLSLHDLKEGTRLKTSKSSVEIISVKKRPSSYIGSVYNLKINGSDRYLIGEDAVVVRDY
jgi:hypothetical protein